MPTATLTNCKRYKVGKQEFLQDVGVEVDDAMAAYLRETGYFSLAYVIEGDDPSETDKPKGNRVRIVKVPHSSTPLAAALKSAAHAETMTKGQARNQETIAKPVVEAPKPVNPTAPELAVEI